MKPSMLIPVSSMESMGHLNQSGVGDDLDCVYGQANIIMTSDMPRLMRFEDRPEPYRRKTKIVCTMGPACWSTERLVEMIDKGMNVARLNFSHGDHTSHGATIDRLNEAQALRPERTISYMLDTKGPEIRTGMLEGGQTVELHAGGLLTLTTDYEFKGNSSRIACSYPKLPLSVREKGLILVADGSITLEVVSISPSAGEVVTRVVNGGKLGERKNMNLPGCVVDLPVISEKDRDDLVNFAIPRGCHFIAASFVQSAADVRHIREILGDAGKHIHIISKIENQAGLKNFDSILAETDGIMVARGDLGMEIPPEKVFLAQKMMIGKCNLVGKPVITATQMLESMVKSPRPTRAEASDVANAVLDGTDCVMLSGETANGDFPLHSVHIMKRICEEAEGVIDYFSLFNRIRISSMTRGSKLDVSESVCSSAVKAAMDVGAKLILAMTETGTTARLVAKYRPAQPIVAISTNPNTTKHLQVVRGCIALCVPSLVGTDKVINKTLESAKAMGLVSTGDKVVAIHGMQEDLSGFSHLMKVLDVR